MLTFEWNEMKVETAELIAGRIDVFADAPLMCNPLAVKKGMYQLRSKFQSKPQKEFALTELGDGKGSAVQVPDNPFLFQRVL